MAEFKVGDTVQITGNTMTGNVGTVTSNDEKREKYLVLISAVTQNYFTADELKLFKAQSVCAAGARFGREAGAETQREEPRQAPEALRPSR